MYPTPIYCNMFGPLTRIGIKMHPHACPHENGSGMVNGDRTFMDNHITLVNTYFQLDRPWKPTSIIITSCQFLYSMLQYQPNDPNDVGRPFLCLLMLYIGTSFSYFFLLQKVLSNLRANKLQRHIG